LSNEKQIEENQPKGQIRHIEHWQKVAIFLAAYDFAAICISYFLALWIRFHSCKFGTMKYGR